MILAPLALAAVLAGKGPFDAPRSVERADLPPDASGLAGRLTCTDYPGFVVKEVDRGEKGAERHSIVRYDPAGRPPPCRLEPVPGEVELAGWAGYFAGARGRFVFLRGDDAWEAGSTGFAVFDARTGRKLLEDAAVPGPEGLVLEAAGDDLVIRFRRAWRAPCSMVKDAAACWQRVRSALALPGAPPPCAAAYAREQADPAGPSVVTYDAEVPSLAARRVRPAARPRVACSPGI